MKRFYLLLLLMGSFGAAAAQAPSYADSLRAFRKNYVETHEVVKAADQPYFRFYAAEPAYRVTAQFEPIADTLGFNIPTMAQTEKKFYRYGILRFQIRGNRYQLTVYQMASLRNSSKFRDYLFVPFTDSTSGNSTYGGGRYIDLLTTDIQNGNLILDFNKAYNPYCAYAPGYQCPIPPKENKLPVAIRAGEKLFGKAHE
jgi:uncharacterized protein (DUF1684 family)